MKPHLVKLALISGCALTALPAFAQTSVQPRSTAAAAAAKTLTMVTAAGSVLILSDGIVAGAVMAQIQAPAPGFVYER
jgi:arginine/ornithine N-succinyltransferase beta subunit